MEVVKELVDGEQTIGAIWKIHTDPKHYTMAEPDELLYVGLAFIGGRMIESTTFSREFHEEAAIHGISKALYIAVEHAKPQAKDK